jgi:uncharacterized phage protein gp47/JayE
VSRLVFDPNTGLKIPETSEIRAEVVELFKKAFYGIDLPELDTEPTSPAGQLVDALVAEIEAKNSEILYLANQFNPKVAEGRWQDALGNIYFLSRKKAEPTIVTCQLTGLPETKIPYGVLIEDSESHRFLCNKSITLDSKGLGETTFRCTVFGPIDVGPGSITKIVTSIAGWDTVSNSEAGAIGRDLESRSDFEARRFGSVAINAHGSVSSIYGSLHNLSGVAGVIDVQVLENIGPDPITKFGVIVPGHGITVCIFGGQDAEIAKVIYEKKDAGCDTGGNTVVSYVNPENSGAVYQFNILRPETVNFWVKVTLGSTEILTVDLKAKIKKAILDDFTGQNSDTGNPRIGLASTVFASRFYCAVLNAGTKNLYEISVRLGDTGVYQSMVEIMGDQEPVMSEANIDVEVKA